jgi:hypothetical protein
MSRAAPPTPRKKRAPGLLDPEAPIKPVQDCLNLSNAPWLGKSSRRQKLGDDWLEARIHSLASELKRTDGGPIARRFLHKARGHFRQFCAGCGDRERYLAWDCLNVVAGQLLGRTARPDGKLHRGEESL